MAEQPRRSELLRAILAKNMFAQQPLTTATAGNAALLATLATAIAANKAGKQEQHADSVDSSNLAYTLAKQFAPQTQITLDGLPGEQPTTTSVNSAPVTSTPQYNALKGMPKEALQTVLMNQMFGGGQDPKVVSEGGALVDPSGKEIYKNPKPAKQDNQATSVEEFSVVLGKPANEWTSEDRSAYREFVKGKGVNVSVNTGENAFSKGIGEASAAALKSEYEEARTASAALPNYDQALQLLDSGVISGTGAEARLALARGLKTAGVYDGDVTNTDTYLAEAGKFVAEEIKSFGSGTGLSDADREFAKKIAGGDISINADSLRRILKIGRKARINKLSYFNGRRAALMEVDPLIGKVLPEFQIPDEPTPEQDRRSRAGL